MVKLGSVNLDIRDYASQGNAILGIRDSGKSYTATYMAEQLLLAGIPFVAFDPIGLWRFLRVAGRGAGFPVVVAGGAHADLPLSPQSAPEIVRAAMREGVSLVIDLYSMELSKADWKRIVEKSVRVLLYENKTHGLRHIFIEEAAEFCPQRVGPDQGAVYAEIEKLARMGGNALLGYTLINQRGEEVNKAVLELCDGLFLHRAKGRNSLTALSKWLDIADAAGGKDVIRSLPTLGQGECWIWAAGSDKPMRVRVPEKRTFHPDRRAMRDAVAPADHKTVNVSQFVDHMKGTLQAIVAEAAENDPKTLRKRIAELEKSQGKVAAPAVDTDVIYRSGYSKALDDIRAKCLHPLQWKFGAVKTQLDEMAAMCQAHLPYPEVPKTDLPPRLATPLVQKTNGTARSDVKLAKSERAILSALAQYPDGRTKTQVAILTGYAVSGGGFNNAISALRSAGRVEGSGDALRITGHGVDDLGHYDPLPSGDALLSHWLGQLGKAERAALEVAARAYPRAVSKEELADAAGYEASGGGFNNALSRLRTLELITGRGEIKASDDLFGA